MKNDRPLNNVQFKILNETEKHKLSGDDNPLPFIGWNWYDETLFTDIG